MEVVRIATLSIILTSSGCGLGAGVVALRGATTKHATFQTGNNCTSSDTPVWVNGQIVAHETHTSCESYNAPETHDYNPNWMHFGVLLGLKEGYASGSYATSASASGSASGRTIEPYFDVNVQLSRFGLALEFGWAGHSLDEPTGLSYGAWPLSLLGLAAVGPLTLFGGIGTLTMATLSNNSSLDADLGGYRLLGGLKGRAFSLFDDQIDVYPRIEVQSTHATGDNGLSYSGTGVDATLELGF